MWLTILWNNRKPIAEGGMIALVVFCAWWFFWRNPKIIDGLEKDKVELSRIIKVKDNQINLYDNIEKGKVVINENVYKQISSMRATARPRHTIIIHHGLPLSTLPTGKITN